IWYRDTTLHWLEFKDFMSHAPSVATVVEYQPSAERQVALVSPLAMLAHLRAREFVRTAQWPLALQAVNLSDSLQRDPGALVLLSSNAYHRAYSLAAMGRLEEGEREARRALAMGQVNHQARFVLSLVYLSEGRRREAEDELDSLLVETPGDPDAIHLLREVRQR